MKHQMKWKKVPVICLLATVSFLVLIWCLIKPTTIHNSSVSQFGHYNASTLNLIQKNGQLLFPKEIQAGMTIELFDYYYQCAFLGAPSFCIFAKVSFKSSSDFEEEKQRIIDNSNLIKSADNRMICMSKNSSDLDYYLDNVVYDGLAFLIECAVVFDDEHVEFIYANWQDSAGKNEFLDSIAEECAKVNCNNVSSHDYNSHNRLEQGDFNKELCFLFC